MTNSRMRDRAARAAVLLLIGLAPIAGLPWAAGAQTPGASRGQVRADYDPTMGVRLTSPDGAVEVTAPVGALSEPATFSQETMNAPTPGGGIRLARAFTLEATSTNGNQPLTHFAKPLRLVVRFTDADAAAVGAPPSRLRLFFQDASGAWRIIPTTVDVAGKKLSATVDHFTTFASGTVGMSDDFNRPDSNTSLGTTSTGQTWQTDGSTWGICTNIACVFGPTGTGDYVRIDSGLTDQHVSVAISPRAVGATGQAGILLGVTPDWNTNLLYAGLDPAGTVEVWTLTGGTWSNGAIASVATGLTGAVAHTLEAGTSGTSLTVLVDGSQVLGPITVPAAPADGTMAGLFVDSTEAAANWPTYDNFAVSPGP